ADLAGDALSKAAESLARKAGRGLAVLAVPTDVSDRGAVAELKARAYDAFGHVDVLMNNAGCSPETSVFTNPTNWRRVIDTNFWGVLNGIQSFGPAMIAQGTD